ncbi:MAG: EAL domain-containing protein [Proteobacteria bacterium]|nr:EAL domain-containing protein [Pseudomonadota bacterium]
MLAELEEINQSRDDTLRQLQSEHHKLDAAINNMTHGLVMFDADGRVVVCNGSYRQMFGLTDVPAGTPGGTLIEAIKLLLADGHADFRCCYRADAEPARQVNEISLRDGRQLAASFSQMANGGWIEVYHDITDQKQAAEKIEFLARHDPLTALPNRHVFNEIISHQCKRALRGAQTAVLCLDLDHFKMVNDTLGHPIGDRLLRKVAHRLANCVRPVDTIARLGGDEFAIIQVDAHQPHGAAALAQRLVAEISRPYDIDGHKIVIGTSIGIALSPDDGVEADVLVRNADMALYRAKAEGRGAYRYFEAGMDRAIQARRKMELELRAALKTGQFELHYQPLFELGLEAVSACEALIRWNHPDGRVPPDQFIPLAEEIGLMAEIGDWVLKEACKTAATWPNDIGVAVNISAVQFKSPSLVDIVKSALQESGLEPSRLELEITETILLQDTTRTLSILHELRSLGVRIAMDDFGTGYSSLSYLRKFPFDKLKIDRSFVSDLCKGTDAAAIVKAVANLACSLGIRTTAEGVETAEQLATLRQLNCTEIQGYLISRPLPTDEIHELICRDHTGSAEAERQELPALVEA